MSDLVDTRRCRRCDGEDMSHAERRWTGMGTEYVYQCPQCGYAVKLMPPGAVGSGILLWLVGSVLVTALFLTDRWYGPGIIGWALIGLFWFGGAAVYLPALWRLIAHPVTGQVPSPLPAEPADGDPLRRGIRSVERRGFFGAPLLLIAGAAAILLLAAAIGYINDVLLG
jgi:hypothetical protein